MAENALAIGGSMDIQAQVQAAAEQIKHAQRVVVLTGAGTSKESGLATYRDPMEGLWEKYDPKELATPAVKPPRKSSRTALILPLQR